MQDLRQPVVIIAASVRLFFPEGGDDPDSFSHCSGTYISDTGTILTGSHCLDHCRFEADGSPKGGAPVTSCKVEIDGKLQDVAILKAARCPTEIKIKYLANRRMGVVDTRLPANCLSTEFDDSAVIQPLRPDLLSRFTCVNVSEEQIALGQKVFTLSYPSPTARFIVDPLAKDANKPEMYLSKGEVIQSTTCQKVGSVSKEVQLSQDAELMSPRMIQTTVDIVRGSSGGALLSDRGEIVGVASFVDGARQNANTECRGASFYQAVSGLKKEMGEALGSCKRRDANRGRPN